MNVTKMLDLPPGWEAIEFPAQIMLYGPYGKTAGMPTEGLIVWSPGSDNDASYPSRDWDSYKQHARKLIAELTAKGNHGRIT